MYVKDAQLIGKYAVAGEDVTADIANTNMWRIDVVDNEALRNPGETNVEYIARLKTQE